MRKNKAAPAMTEKEVEQAFKESAKRKKKAGKSYEIYKASPKPWSEYNAIDVDGRRLDFGRSGAMRVRDKKLAMDIKDALGGRPGEADVVVVEVDDVPKPHEGGNKSWTINAPWKDK